MDDLHVLIKSLSESDKKFFRQYASLQIQDAKYLLLFNAIDQMDVYDEAKIKVLFKGENFIKQLPVAKNYLNEVILRTFRFTAELESPEIALQLLMLDIRFLLSKKCLTQMKKVLKRAKKLAEEQENFLILLNIFSLQRHLLTEFKIQAWENISLESIFREETQILEKAANVSKMYDLYCNCKIILTSEGERTKSEIVKQEMHRLASDIFLQSEENAISVRSKHWYFSLKHFIHIYYNAHQEDFTNALHHLKLFEENETFAKSRPLSLLTVINNILEALRNLNQLQEVETNIAKLQGVEVFNEREKAGKEIYLSHHRMWYFTRIENKIQAIKYADIEFERLQNFTKLKQDSIIIQYMMIAILYISFQLFEKAQYVANILLSIPKSGIREDILFNAKALNLIIHAHQKNYTIAKDLLRSVQRNSQNNTLHIIIVSYYSSYLKMNDKESIQKLNIQFSKQIYPFSNRNKEFPEITTMLKMIWKPI